MFNRQLNCTIRQLKVKKQVRKLNDNNFCNSCGVVQFEHIVDLMAVLAHPVQHVYRNVWSQAVSVSAAVVAVTL